MVARGDGSVPLSFGRRAPLRHPASARRAGRIPALGRVNILFTRNRERFRWRSAPRIVLRGPTPRRAAANRVAPQNPAWPSVLALPIARHGCRAPGAVRHGCRSATRRVSEKARANALIFEPQPGVHEAFGVELALECANGPAMDFGKLTARPGLVVAAHGVMMADGTSALNDGL